MIDERMKPIFAHDCKECVYLATVMGYRGPVDWYIHRRDNGRNDEMIGRHGDEPSHNITPYWPMPFTAYHYKGDRLALMADAVIAHALREKFLSSNDGANK